jgi:glutathione S-transferase
MLEKLAKLESKPTSYGWGSFDLMLATLRGELAKGEWLLGESFSAADVLVGTAAYFLNRFGLIGEDPAITPYIERCASRPAWQRAQAFDAA